MTMTKLMSGLALGVMVLGSVPAPAATAGGPAAEDQPIVLAEEAPAVSEILMMEPANLLMLGVGALVGAIVIGPYLGISELIGVAVGAIAGEALYQSHLLFSRGTPPEPARSPRLTADNGIIAPAGWTQPVSGRHATTGEGS